MTFEEFDSRLKHKDEWKLVDPKDTFCVTITRHLRATFHPTIRDAVEYVNQWCVYAYIYPAHRLFSDCCIYSYSPAIDDLPFHGGITYRRVNTDHNKYTSVQLGADYNRDGDQRFWHYATKEEAHEVFRDAYRLFVELSKQEPENAAEKKERLQPEDNL